MFRRRSRADPAQTGWSTAGVAAAGQPREPRDLESLVAQQIGRREAELAQIRDEQHRVVERIRMARTDGDREHERMLEEKHLTLERHRGVVLEFLAVLFAQYGQARLVRARLQNQHDLERVLELAGRMPTRREDPVLDAGALSGLGTDLQERYDIPEPTSEDRRRNRERIDESLSRPSGGASLA